MPIRKRKSKTYDANDLTDSMSIYNKYFALIEDSLKKKHHICSHWGQYWDSGKIDLLKNELTHLDILIKHDIQNKSLIHFLYSQIDVRKKIVEASKTFNSPKYSLNNDLGLLEDLSIKEYDSLSHISTLYDQLRKNWRLQKKFFSLYKKSLLALSEKRSDFFELIKKEEILFTEFSKYLDLLKKEIEKEIEYYAKPTIADKLEFNFDGTVNEITKRVKATMVDRDGNRVICPHCMNPESNLKHYKKSNTFICSYCHESFTSKERELILNIEKDSGVLLDFNIDHRPKYDSFNDSRKHLVLDHHGKYDKDMLTTGTTEVIDYIKLIKKNKKFTQFKLLKNFYKNIMHYADGKKLSLYASHIDIDMILAHFAFRNPNTALKYETILKKLSWYGDLMKIDPDVKQYYYIINSYFTFLNKKIPHNQAVILEILVRDLKNILDYPSKYERLRREEEIRLNNEKAAFTDFKSHVRLIPGFEDQLLEYVSKHDIFRRDTIYEILLEKENSHLNTPLLINFPLFNSLEEHSEFYVPLVIRTDITHRVFSLAVNPNHPDFSHYDLRKLQVFFKTAEDEIISVYEKEINQYEKELNNIDDNIKKLKSSSLSKLMINLRKQISTHHDTVDLSQFLNSFIDVLNHQSELRNKDKNVLYATTTQFCNGKKQYTKKEMFTFCNDIDNVFLGFYNSQKNNLRNQRSKLPSKEEFLKHKKKNTQNQIWIAKHNLLLNSKYKTYLSYDEIISLVTSHLKNAHD